MPVVRSLAPADSYVAGRLDVTTAADLRAELLGVLERRIAKPPVGGADPGMDFVVDLSGVDIVDMVGVGLLVGVHRQAGRRGLRLVLTGPPPQVIRLLAATRLRRVLVVRDLPRSAAAQADAAGPAAPIVLDAAAELAI